MKKLVTVVFWMFCCSAFCFAQDTIKSYKNIQHNLYLELGGNSVLIYNITYDCSFQLAEKHKMTAGLGVQYIPFKIPLLFYPHTFGISPQINYLYGQKHHLEVGTGISFPFLFYYDYHQNEWIANIYPYIPLRIGYRYQKDNDGLFWKIAFVPLSWIEDGKIHFFPSGGIAIGYTFKKNR
jgi:hypothetical protein